MMEQGRRNSFVIDLVVLGTEGSDPEWSLGTIWRTQRTTGALADTVEKSLSSGSSEALFFWDPTTGAIPNRDLLMHLLASTGHAWHAGLRLGMSGHPSFIDFVAPTWMLNRDPAPDIRANSWRLSLDAALIRTDVLGALGGLDAHYESLDAVALDLGYRCITKGALIAHVPDLSPEGGARAVSIPPVDQTRFVFKGWGRTWAAWACFRAVLTRQPGCVRALRALISTEPRPPDGLPLVESVSDPENGLELAAPKVSVLLPTLGRYPYLRKALSDVADQTVRPHEVIVVDGNQDRENDWEGGFTAAPLKVIAQEKPGQCTARNLGIREVTGDWILFIDDDDELPPDLIEKHLHNIRSTGADVSCGVVDEVGSPPRREAYRIKRISDGFPTDNMLARADSVRRAGLFDERLDRGEREDHDLGMRVYLQGDLLVQDPEVVVLHHHAAAGGLRTHGSRINTYGASRQRLLVRRLPTPSDIYIERKYHTSVQVRESKWLALLGTMRMHGRLPLKLLKLLLGFVLMPHSALYIRRSETIARRWG